MRDIVQPIWVLEAFNGVCRGMVDLKSMQVSLDSCQKSRDRGSSGCPVGISGTGTSHRVRRSQPDEQTPWRLDMGRGLLLWLLGIPLPIILVIWLLGGLN